VNRAHAAAWLVFLPTVLAGAPRLSRAQAVTTSQYDNARTGANLHETQLTPASVNANHFGKLRAFKVDGAIYAQPLYVPRLGIPGKGVHDVVFVATEHDSVYAFDVEGPATPLWKVNFTDPAAGVSTVPVNDVQCPFIAPEIGITSTPVIDLDTGTLYVLARTREAGGVFSSNHYMQKLHALAITTGAEKFGGPVEIKASVPGRGAGSSGGRVSFDPLHELDRAALLLSNGNVYLGWASSCDVGPYFGWMMAYDAQTLAQKAVWNSAPDTGQSGIWAGDTGPAADDQGNVFVATGNGFFDAAKGSRDYGDTIVKLNLENQRMAVRDYFTPSDEKQLNSDDNDLGSGGPLLLPDQPGQHPHLLVIAGKGGTVYLIDRDHMGKFHEFSNSALLQSVQLNGSAFGAPAYWNHHLFYLASDDVLKDFAVEGGKLKLAAHGGTQFIDPGATPTVSANGSNSGIIWVMSSKRWNEPDGPRAVLHAYDAANVAHELYTSEQHATRDGAGIGLRFNIPTVVDGRVFVGAKGELDVYGLLH
jgi:hypothetical protein